MTLPNYPIDTEEASRHLGISKSSLEKLRVYGGGPQYLKVGRLVRYRHTDLEKWLRERIATSTSDLRGRKG